MQSLKLLKAKMELRLHYLTQALTRKASVYRTLYSFNRSMRTFRYKLRFYDSKKVKANIAFDNKLTQHPVCFVIVKDTPFIMIDINHAPVTVTSLTMHVEACINEICDYQADTLQVGDGFVIRNGETHALPEPGTYEFIAPTIY